MAVSSEHVIKAVSKKLKYYIDVRRLEDGFDLSGVDCPRLDHPPTKARPTLMYDGLHDRPLKHYFSNKEVKKVLTQFKAPTAKTTREREIRKQVEGYLRRYQFMENALKKDSSSRSTSGHSAKAPSSAKHRKARPTLSAKSTSSDRQPSILSDGFYNFNKKSKTLKPEASGGFGVGLRRRKSKHRGGQPVLRSVPPTGLSRYEADRLLNNASKLLVATETIDLKESPTGKNQNEKTKEERRGAPRQFEPPPRRRHVIYTYDVNGRRIAIRKKEPEDDSAYNSPPQSVSPGGNYVTITGDKADDQVMPRWLRKEISREGGGADSGRPHSAFTASGDEGSRGAMPASHASPSIVPEPRPRSAADVSHRTVRPRPRHRGGGASDRASSTLLPQPKLGWQSESRSGDDSSEQPSESTTVDTGVQTGGELLKNYEPTECVLFDGEPAEYEVRVFTGQRMGAGTRADIRIALIGDAGRTQEIPLERSSTHKIKFQKGQEDIFKLDTFYVGPIRKIAIGHERKELGYGWYLSRVEVRDLSRCLQYNFQCERWLSYQEADKRTFREFPLDYSSSFTPETPESSESTPRPEPEAKASYAPASRSPSSQSNASTRTSLATIYSDRGGQPQPPKQARPRRYSHTSQSTSTLSSSSTTSSSASSYYRRPRVLVGSEAVEEPQTELIHLGGSSDEETRRLKKEEAEADEKKEEPTPKPLPPLRPLDRRDTFFDQRPVSHEYSSVIDSLSHTTEQDQQDRQQDFSTDQPQYKPAKVTNEGPRLKDDEETGRLKEEDVADPQADRAEREQLGERLSLPPTAPPEEAKGVYLDGFKAGIEAAKSKQVPIQESSAEESEDDLERGPSIHDTAKTGDLDRLKKLIDQNKSRKDSVDERGWAPVHHAAASGHTDIIKWLAVSNADLNVETPTSYTAMHLAAMHGHTNTMIVLYAMGAKLASKTVSNETPLHIAAMRGHLESVKWLVANRAPIDCVENQDRLPVDLAVEFGHDEVARFLRSCEQGGGLALIRTSSSSSLGEKSDGKGSYTSATEDSEDEGPDWKNDSQLDTARGRKTSTGRSDEDTQSHASLKHDEELMEKKKIYEDQQRRMSERHMSFLDAIRNEVD